MAEPTPDQVRAFWAYMTGKYGTKVVPKAASPEMLAVADLLDGLGIVQRDTFMTRFVTTIGKVIYVPFDVGAVNGWSLWDQIGVCAHEHQHVVQETRLGAATFGTQYLLDPDARGVLEAEAYRVSLTLDFWHLGKMPFIPVYADLLKSYGVPRETVDFVSQYGGLSAVSILRGAVPDEAAKVAIEWLTANTPGCKA